MSFDLTELLKFRTEIGRELLNVEVDQNFKFVANPWMPKRTYTEGEIIYHEIEVTTDPVSGETSVTSTTTRLAWFRAKQATTKGTFLADEWDEIGGGIGTGSSFGDLNFFDAIIVNSTTLGSFSTSTNATVLPSGSDSLEFLSGTGIQLEHDVTKNLIRVNTDLTLIFNSGTGDLSIDGGSTVNLNSLAGGFWDRDSGNGFVFPVTLSDKVGFGTNTPSAIVEFNASTGTGTNDIMLTKSTVGEIFRIDDAARISISTSNAQRFKELAQAGVNFSDDGDARCSRVIAKIVTTTSSFVEMFLDGIDETVDLFTDVSIIGFKITVTAIEEFAVTKDATLRLYKGAIKKDGTTTSLLGAVTEEIIAEDTGANAWDVEVTADNSNNYLKIRVRGDGSTIRWIASIELTEINVQ